MNIYKIFLLIAFACSNKLIAQPTISSFSPKSGPVGTLVTINGTFFNAVADQNIVYFGAAKAIVISATNSTLIVKAPAGASYEPITVTSNKLTAYAGGAFVFTFAGGGLVDSASFTSKKNLEVLPGGYCMAVGDLDGDGKPDIAYSVDGNVSMSLSILRNTSTQGSLSFAQRVDFPANFANYDIKIGDLNGDGKPDIVIANPMLSFSFSVYMNTSTVGSISFIPLGTIKTDPQPMAITIGDVDGDGRPDVITSNNVARRFCIFRNTGVNGSITFAPKVDILIPASPERLSLEDMDGDGKIDLVYFDLQTTVVRRNTSSIGEISFGETTALGMGTGYNVVSIGDLDGDGKADLAVTTNNTLSGYKNTSTLGQISFASPVNYNAGVTFDRTCLSDINGDGKPDLVGLSRTINNIYVLGNTSTAGNISFAPKTIYSVGGRPYVLAGADMDGDGKPEILTYNATDSISILRNKTGEPATVSSGANPVTGNVTNEVIVDETVQTYYGNPYVQRHYDIEPEINPGTSTATIILYFTQQEFNNFNAHPARSLSLPTGANDIAGKANLRVYQYHGTSATSTPGTYNGSGTEINPDDAKIIWNDLLKRWEVTFDVTGFSGFFVSSSSNAVLPLTLLSFNATVKDDKVLFEWITTNELNVAYFELQRSTDGNNYNTVAKITAKGVGTTNTQYNSTDKPGEENNYYRLKIVDKDGSLKYSNILKINFPGSRSALSIFPNPAHGSVTVGTPVVSSQSELRLMDMTGRLVRVITIGKNSISTKIDLHNVRPGTYKMLWTDGIKSGAQTFIVE